MFLHQLVVSINFLNLSPFVSQWKINLTGLNINLCKSPSQRCFSLSVPLSALKLHLPCRQELWVVSDIFWCFWMNPCVVTQTLSEWKSGTFQAKPIASSPEKGIWGVEHGQTGMGTWAVLSARWKTRLCLELLWVCVAFVPQLTLMCSLSAQSTSQATWCFETVMESCPRDPCYSVNSPTFTLHL